MPAKTKKTRAVRTTARKTAKKSQGFSLRNFKLNRQSGLLLVVIVAVVGAFVIFNASAATTNFEAESASRNSLVSRGSDSTASGGEFISFAKPNTTTTSGGEQRFPGDPNPRVTGKTYWGANVTALLADGSKTSDVAARHERPAGASLSLNHTYHQWTGIASGSMVNRARQDHAANRLPYVTFKTIDDWGAIGRGQHDASLDKLIRELDALGKPVWVTMFHEPENDTNGGTRTSSTWQSMQRRFRQRMDAVGAQNIAFMPHLMDGTTRSASKANSWWVDGIWDAVMFSNYCQRDCVDKGGNTYDTQARTQSIQYIQSKGLPWGVGEWSLSERRTGDLKFTHLFEPYFEWGFNNNSDAIGYSYFDADESRPDTSSPYYASLRDENLDEFHRILRDPRVMRINDLGKPSSTSSSTTDYGTATANVEVPENGTYKLWVRMSAPDSTSNAVQAQIDGGTVAKIGDGGLAANTWTWVDWKNGDKNNKTTFALNAGARKVTLTGIEGGVKIDRVLLTNETCQPTGTGDNCTNIAPDPVPTPQVGITSPVDGATVKGTVKVTAASSGDVSFVSFRLGKSDTSTTWQATDSSAPFEWSWDTTKVANGSYRIVTRTNMKGDPGNVYTTTSIGVTVNNGTAVVEQPPEPARDTEAPTAPTSLRASLSLDWTKFAYVMNLNWTAASDNNEVTAYQISRNGTQVGTTANTNFTDASELASGQTYTYSVTASDAAANKSKAATINMQTQCNWIFCTAQVL